MNRCKHIITAFLMLLLLTATSFSVQAASEREVKITIAKDERNMWTDTTRPLTVKLSTPSVITYKTSDKRRVIAKNGRLYAYKPGRAEITIIAKPKSSRYRSAEKRLIVNVIPVKPGTPSLKRSGTKVTASTNNVNYAAGYQFQYALDSSMKDAETVTVKIPSFSFRTKESRYYYVRAQAYTKVSGKTFASGWTSVRRIKGVPPEPEKPVQPPETGIPQIKVPLIAHRGAANLAPENTLPAFELAAKNGFTALECDVRETKDGFLVISHDNSLKDSCGVDLAVSELTLEEVRSYSVKRGSHASKYPDNRIPTLSEFLNLCNQYGCTPVVELKMPISNGGLNRLYNLLSGSAKKPVVISFVIEPLIYLRKLDPELELQEISTRWSRENLEKCKEYNLDMSINQNYLSQTAITETHKAGLKIATWLTVKRQQIHYWDKAGVDYITCETSAVIP